MSLEKMATGILFYLFFSVTITFAQKTHFGEFPDWVGNGMTTLPVAEGDHMGGDLVILSEKTNFYFYSKKTEKIVRHILVKINSEKGKKELERFILPESFDRAHDLKYFKQGRRSGRPAPFVYDYTVNSFAARKLVGNDRSSVPFDYKYESFNWISASGANLKDQVMVFELKGLDTGDVVDILYDLSFVRDYADNLFYFHSQYPKLVCEYNFIYAIDDRMAGTSFVAPMHVREGAITRQVVPADSKGKILITDRIRLRDLKGINYPEKSCPGLTLPHVYVDFNYHFLLLNRSAAGVEYTFVRPANFEWIVPIDTINYFTRVYDKQYSTLKKFVATLPSYSADSTHKAFFNALCDTFNSFRFYTMNHLYYNESHLVNVSSGDHLLKRRLVDEHLWKLYEDILNNNKIFYYRINVMDRRFGEHSRFYRTHSAYECELIGVPSGDNYLYFMPRYGGVKYHLNELPFFLEGSTAALLAKNHQDSITAKAAKNFKFMKTHKSSANDNSRVETAIMKVKTDSLKIDFTTKETLTGQFSTILRHYYLNDPIDSTIERSIFRKCVDKPGVRDAKIKLSSRATVYPYRYSFNCNGKMSLENGKAISLKNWFSFPLSAAVLPEMPNHNYFIDFEFSDLYNFMLEFDRPVRITNLNDFSKKISNRYFDLESRIVAQSEKSWLIKVDLIVKERQIPLENLEELMALVRQLDELNNFVLQLDAK